MSEAPVTPSAQPTPSALRELRRTAVIFIIVSLSITALVGIVTLLTASFGEVQAKVILTTLLVAAFSITALCHLAVVGRAPRVVGFAGIAASVLALITGVVLIWGSWDNWNSGWETLLKAFAVLGVLAVSLAHANLLLLLGDRPSSLIRYGLIATVGLIALLALLIVLPIVTDGRIPGDNDVYWRILGVVAILDVLGTIVLPVVSRFSAGGRAGVSVTVRLTGDAAAKIHRIATQRGSTPAAVVETAVADLPEQ
ncbi:MAG: hypothetical protein ACKVOG_11925 [Rhodoglobus sp.]